MKDRKSTIESETAAGGKNAARRICKYGLFCLLSLMLGFVSGAAVWFVLQIINLATKLVWSVIPDQLGIMTSSVFGAKHPSFLYCLCVCVTGSLLIGLWQKKHGVLPDSMEEVLGKLKSCGGYPYDRLHIIAVAALLPLMFGGTLGPEAGLTGLTAGLCCWVADRLRYKGEEVTALAEAGFAATVGVIFGTPLFGVVHNLEPDDNSERYGKKLVSRRTRIIIYCFGACGGMLAFSLLSRLFHVEAGLPRFDAHHAVGLDQWMWFIPLLAFGIILALYFQGVALFVRKLAGKMVREASRVSTRSVLIRCLIPGVLIAFCGYFVPLSMFSGEHQLPQLMEDWTTMSVAVLIISAVLKLFMVNLCIGFGWKGGSIFPIISGGAMAGYAFALIVGMDGAFAVAILVAALYAYISRKPAATIAILLLCFPVTYILPLTAAAIVAAKIPSPFKRKDNQ